MRDYYLRDKEPLYIKLFKEILICNDFKFIKEEDGNILGERDSLTLKLERFTAPNGQKAYRANLYDKQTNMQLGLPTFKDRSGKVKQRQYRLYPHYLRDDVREMLDNMNKRNLERKFIIIVTEQDSIAKEFLALGNGYENLVLSENQFPKELKGINCGEGTMFMAEGIVKEGEVYTVRKIVSLVDFSEIDFEKNCINTRIMFLSKFNRLQKYICYLINQFSNTEKQEEFEKMSLASLVKELIKIYKIPNEYLKMFDKIIYIRNNEMYFRMKIDSDFFEEADNMINELLIYKYI